MDFPDSIQDEFSTPIFESIQFPPLDWYSEISKFQHDLNFNSWVCPTTFGDDDEILGTINKIYDPPGYGGAYGGGRHEVKRQQW